MAAIGGSIRGISIKGRDFPVAADSDGTRDLGGFSVEVQSNGNGTARKVMTRKPWMIEGLAVSVDDDRSDQKFLQDVCDGKDAGDDGYYDCTITLVSGNTFQGRGTISGDLKFSTQNATCELALAGPDSLTKQ